jgi:feruloyl esterase
MSLTLLLLLGALARAGAPAAAQELAPLPPVITCSQVAQIDVSLTVGVPTHVVRVEEIRADGAKPYCKVEGLIDPKIHFELRLPTEGWTQRYLQVGCGGLCGFLVVRLEHANGCVPVDQAEVALAATDMGHTGMAGKWAAGDRGAKVDFGYRAVHLTAIAAKAIIARFYNRPARYSYFSGCSDGGREALIEAQRFPEDFDGIAAGAPALNFTVQNSFYHAWNALSNTGADGRAILTSDKLPILHAAVMSACDAVDGSKDGLISDPRRCQFDPAVVSCKAQQDPSQCLTPAQVEVVRKIYEGAHDAQGKRLVAGGPMLGSELAWEGVFVPRRADQPVMSAGMATESIRNLYFDAPLPQTWSLRELKFDAETMHSFTLRGLYDATDPDLTRFKNQGGKLILWHGWSDPHISPLNSIAYLAAVERQLGRDTAASFARLFLIPGMYHCSGGEGSFEFDVLTPLMDWVEHQQAPAQVIVGARPVFPYPAVARYIGHGDRQAPSSYLPLIPPDVPALPWLGDSFFTPGYELK